VILKVGNDPISTTADWDRALRANQGKPVQVTILRDRKLQTINLQVDSKHKSAVDYHDLFPGLLPDGPCPLLAELDPAWGADAVAAAETFSHQMEQFRQNFNSDNFKIDSKQMDELKKQMEQFRQDFKAEDFKVNPKDMEQFGKDMEQLRHKFGQKQMDQLRQQMKQFQQEMQQLHQEMSHQV
jgi:DNA repair exonuclease SbcCD ATPase subunit